MADFTKLDSDLNELNAKIDVLIANQAVPVPAPVDEQPKVDDAAAKVEAMLAKIP